MSSKDMGRTIGLGEDEREAGRKEGRGSRQMRQGRRRGKVTKGVERKIGGMKKGKRLTMKRKKSGQRGSEIEISNEKDREKKKYVTDRMK